MQQPIVHVEFPADNPKEAAEFYRKAFDWQIEVDERFDYHQFAAEGGPGGAFVAVGENYKAGEVVVYLQSDDIQANLEKVKANGGSVLVDMTEIPGIGYYAMFSDPTGNKVGLFAGGG